MPHILASPEPRQVPRLRLVDHSEMSEERGTHRADDEAPPTVEPTAEILKACGAMAVAVWHIARSNPEAGIPNTYAMLEEQCELGTRQMQRICGSLVASGFFAVSQEGGGRKRERHFVPLNPVKNPDIKSDTDDTVSGETVSETLTERVTKRVTSPPTPPVVNVPSHEGTRERVNTPPKPPRPKQEPYSEGFDAFWAAYPRKDNRKATAAIWDRIRPGPDLLAKMLAAIERQGLAAKDPQYRPMPTTWLNGERWNDQGGPPAASNGTYPPNGRQEQARTSLDRMIELSRGDR
jgi:hypothetical protein